MYSKIQPGNFKDVDLAVKFIADKIILSSHMLFGDKHNRCQKVVTYCILQQTGFADRSDLQLLSCEALRQDFGRGR